MPVSPGYNTWDGNHFVLIAKPDNVALTPSLVTAFEANDERKNNWVGL